MLLKYKADLIIISLKINLFLQWYNWKIAELALNYRSLTQMWNIALFFLLYAFLFYHWSWSSCVNFIYISSILNVFSIFRTIFNENFFLLQWVILSRGNWYRTSQCITKEKKNRCNLFTLISLAFEQFISSEFVWFRIVDYRVVMNSI